ncbi:MAG: DUF2958 domain-containing protein [Pseudomonadales bacterium]|nr:DUF2958 domain-containing protein [Pseudomonadales bacterium]
MTIFTQTLLRKLTANGEASAARQADGESEIDHLPVIKIFNPAGSATWTLTEIIPDNPDLLFGLCDLGFGTPELGYVSRQELEEVQGHYGLPLERDRHFEAYGPRGVNSTLCASTN